MYLFFAPSTLLANTNIMQNTACHFDIEKHDRCARMYDDMEAAAAESRQNVPATLYFIRFCILVKGRVKYFY